MAGTALQDIKDFHDVIRLLEDHPEWRADLRRLVLTDELLALPQQMTRLTEQVSRLTEQMATLTEIAQRQTIDLAHLKGDGLEARYARRGLPSLTRVVRRPHVLSPEELDRLLEEAEAQSMLSAEESEEIALADLVIRGRRRGAAAGEVYVVSEVSWGVGTEDVQRAARRAQLLAKTGVTTLAAVAGEWVTPDAQQLAPGLGVWQFTPSRIVPPAS